MKEARVAACGWEWILEVVIYIFQPQSGKHKDIEVTRGPMVKRAQKSGVVRSCPNPRQIREVQEWSEGSGGGRPFPNLTDAIAAAKVRGVHSSASRRRRTAGA